jgi:hypothetical protein
MLLDEGRIAFLGSYLDFVASALPTVAHLLHPVPSGPVNTKYMLDPWARKLKPRSRFQ